MELPCNWCDWHDAHPRPKTPVAASICVAPQPRVLGGRTGSGAQRTAAPRSVGAARPRCGCGRHGGAPLAGGRPLWRGTDRRGPAAGVARPAPPPPRLAAPPPTDRDGGAPPAGGVAARGCRPRTLAVRAITARRERPAVPRRVAPSPLQRRRGGRCTRTRVATPQAAADRDGFRRVGHRRGRPCWSRRTGCCGRIGRCVGVDSRPDGGCSARRRVASVVGICSHSK